MLALKPILSRFVERLCADLCLWCLAVILIPVPGTQLSFHSFQRFSCLCHRHCQGKPHQWHLPALGVFTLLSCTPHCSTAYRTQSPAFNHSSLNTQQRAPKSCFSSAYTESGQQRQALQDRWCELQSDSTLLPVCVGCQSSCTIPWIHAEPTLVEQHHKVMSVFLGCFPKEMMLKRQCHMCEEL